MDYPKGNPYVSDDSVKELGESSILNSTTQPTTPGLLRRHSSLEGAVKKDVAVIVTRYAL